ncbi:MAG: hypothetical protein K2Z81_24650 [Cyanobacteria bacterium]|nr:hypothetical protein [Cyanobacteriota bacterium]
MRNSLFRTSAVFIIILSSFVCPHEARAELGWMLEQSTKQNGRFETYLTQTAWKFCNKEKGYSIIQTASGLVYLNDRTRKYLNTTIKGTHLNFLSSSMEGAMNKPKDEHPSMIPKIKRIAGMDTLTYRSNMTSDRRSSNSLNFVRTTYRVAKEIKVAPSLRKIISMSLIVPEEVLTHYPLEAQYLRKDGRSTFMLSTQGVNRKQLPPALFSIPRSYKEAKTEGELFIDANSEALIESIMH